MTSFVSVFTYWLGSIVPVITSFVFVFTYWLGSMVSVYYIVYLCVYILVRKHGVSLLHRLSVCLHTG